MMDSYNEIFATACKDGNIELVMSMIEKGANRWNWGLENAYRYGHKNISSLIIERGANDWERCMSGACLCGYRDFVLAMIKHGANNWNDGLVGACLGGRKDLVMLMIEKGADDWDGALYEACRGRHIELALLMIEKGGNIKQYYKPLPDIHIYYLVQKGVSYFGQYQDVADTFRETQSQLTDMLKLVLNNDLVSEILLC